MKRTRLPSSNQKAMVAKKVQKVNSKARIYKQPTNPIRFVRRNADYGAVPLSGVTGTGISFTFRLSNVAGYSELVSLYDQYKINAVALTFIPRMTAITSTLTAGNIENVRCLTAIDYNDSTAPTGPDVVREYENCEVRGITEQFTVYIDKPKIFDTSSTSRTAWIGTSSATTLHYGLKFWADSTQMTSGNYGYLVEAVFYMAFKAIK